MTRTARRRVLAIVAAAGLAVPACKVGPNYARPELTIPDQYRFASAEARAESVADLGWWQVTSDPELQKLVREAISQNLDLRIAAARVEEARARAGIAKSFYFPEVGAGVGYQAQQSSRLTDPQLPGTDSTHQNWTAGFSLSWELDLFGRLRREHESAYASFLATEQARRGVIVTLVADVASGYLLLRELDLQLEIARRTLKLNDETSEYYRRRLDGGVSNRLEVDQAVANRSRTAAIIPDIERQIASVENTLSFLLGRPPGTIPRGPALGEGYVPPTVPPGVPAALLERRPDVLQAEQQLVAANADIGAAKALFFPTISLTGFLGAVSGQLEDLLDGDAVDWSISPGLFQPLFQGGRIRRNYEAAWARFDQAIAGYRRAALNGYREVADSLVAIRKFAEQRVELTHGVESLRDASTLSRARYDNGLSSYLEVLIADQQLFDQELALARVRGNEARAVVQLYRALGGGWQPEPAGAGDGAAEEGAEP